MKISVNGITVELTVGADPEVFATSKGKLISAHKMVRGTKDMPHPVSCGAIQVDGMALEFNIDAAEDQAAFVTNIKTVMNELGKHLPKDVAISIVPTADFGAAYINSQPEEAKELGCSADLNAYTGGENPKPNAEVPFRTAAGHLHIGWTSHQNTEDPMHMETCCDLIKILDLYLGVPSVIMDPDKKRRSLYGAAGAFRSKSYGAEYRVLSNFWLKNDSYMKWAYKQVTKAVTDYLGGFRIDDASIIIEAINNSNVKAAKSLIKFHKLELPHA